MMQIWKTVWQASLNFIYPSACLVCKVSLPDRPGLCDGCQDNLVEWDADQHKVNFVHKFDQITVLYHFDDCIRSLVHALKYQGKTQLGHLLGQALARRIATNIDSETLIVPVPLHSAKKRARGYNQSEVIARAAADALQLRVMPEVLKRVRPTPSQTQMDVQQRKKNVQGAFWVCKPDAVEGHRVFLIDDVITTGSKQKLPLWA